MLDNQKIFLTGKWRFALDREDLGITNKWYNSELPEEILLPSSTIEQRVGDEVTRDTRWMATLYDQFWYQREEFKKYGLQDNLKIPFMLQPDKYYTGVAWYQYDITIPQKWNNKHVVLYLERAHWETQVWLNDNLIGSNNSLATAHQYKLGVLKSGSYTLTIRVDNQVKLGVGWNAHSVTDHTQGNWNGLIGELSLRATSPVYIDNVQVYPDAKQKNAQIVMDICNTANGSGQGLLTIGNFKKKQISWKKQQSILRVSTEIDFPDDVQLWDEFNPYLHELDVNLLGDHADHNFTVKFGIRDVEVQGNDFLINGRKIFFRGTHEGCNFPLTGYPPTDVQSWSRIIKICQEHGLNHMRFHSWCPPKAAFVAADQLGFYLQPEGPLWARHNGSINPGSEEEKFLYDETERMLKEYGNHPSFILFAYGNEPGGRWIECLTEWVKYYKDKDPRRLYAAETGWSFSNDFMDYAETGVQYAIFGRIGSNFVRGYTGWQGNDFSYTVNNTNVPIISHELGQHCVFPNFRQISKFTGAYKPNNLKLFKDKMVEQGMLHLADDFEQASGKLQALAYKEDIEACLRTPGLGGFQLLDLHDYTGQGTALVGVLDVFWYEKGYISPDEFRQFCDQTVLLARMTKHVYNTTESLDVQIDIAHFGEKYLEDVNIMWVILDKNENQIQTGNFSVAKIEYGTGIPLGRIKVELGGLPAPAQYKLVLTIKNTTIKNSWNFWLYPESVQTVEQDILITNNFNDAAIAKLKDGGKVLFLAGDQLAWDSPPIGFYPVFWNRLMSPKWERTLGLLCDTHHPALAQFPTEYHADWQWEGVVLPNCRAVNLASLSPELKPIVRAIDDWTRSLPLGVVFECLVGTGKLMVCSADLETNLRHRVAAAQLRHSLISYMVSDDFKPNIEVTIEQIRGLLFDSQVMKKLGAKVIADNEIPEHEAMMIIDGNPNTFWQTPVRGEEVTDYPHELLIEFPESVPMDGIVYMNRQSNAIREGDIRDYILEVSEDKKHWVTVSKGELVSSFMPQKIKFSKTISARYIRLKALSGYNYGSVASLAELAIIYAGSELPDRTELKQKEFYVKSETAEVDEPL